MLVDINTTVDHVHTWMMMYKGAPLHLHKMMKPQVELEKPCIQSLIWNYEELLPLVTSVEASYAWLYMSLDVMVRNYGTLLIGMLSEAKEKNQVRLELDAYFYHLILMITSEDLQVSTDNMCMYIVLPTLLRDKLQKIKDEFDRGSKLVCLEEMEARVCF